MSLRAFVERKALARTFARATRGRDNFLPFDFVCEELLSNIYLTEYDFNGTDRARFEETIRRMPGRGANEAPWSDRYEFLLRLEVELRYKEPIYGRIRPRRHMKLVKLVEHMASQLTTVHERLKELHTNYLDASIYGDSCGNYSGPSRLQVRLNQYFFEPSEKVLDAYLEELRSESESLYSDSKVDLKQVVNELETYLLMREILEEEV